MDYEVCIETGNDKNTLYLSTDYPPIINKLQKLIRSNPGDFVIKGEPKTNDGCLYIKMPAKYLSFSFKKRVYKPRDLTEEQREELRARMKKAQAARKEKQANSKEDT